MQIINEMSKSTEELQPSTLRKSNKVRDINLDDYLDLSTNDTYAIDEQILMTPQEFLPVPEDEVVRINSFKRVDTIILKFILLHSDMVLLMYLKNGFSDNLL